MEIMNMLDLDLGMFDPSSILDSMSTHSLAPIFGESLHHTFSDPIPDHKRSVTTYQNDYDRPMKMMKANKWDSLITNQLPNPQVTFPKILSFSNSNYSKNTKQEPVVPARLDHVIAERKRREKLSQKLIALSALVPGLKKMDKASVLGDAIKYLKQLQEQVKALEEQNMKNKIESAVFVKKHELYGEGDGSGSDKYFSCDFHSEPLLEIEAKVRDGDVLIRIHCERKRGIFEKTVSEIEKLHLIVLNSSVLSFGSSIMDITIITQMDTGFPVSTEDLVKHLRDFLNALQVKGAGESV